MYECFLEIAFEADMDTSEHPELLELAEEICNEMPATRNAKITELRRMILDRGECKPFRMDDEFLLKFLRAKMFVVPRAHRLLVRYCTFREQNKQLYQGVDLWRLMKMQDIFEGCFCDKPGVGRITFFRIKKWDPNEFGTDDVGRAAYALAEIASRKPKLQVLGTTLVIDLEGLSMKHISTFTPTVAQQIVSLVGLAGPVKANAIHVVNYSWLLNTFLYLFKRFIPQAAWSVIHFHGSDMQSLHKHLDPEYLHPRYGGTSRATRSMAFWFQRIKKYRDEKFDTDMKQLGYVIKE